MTGISKDADNMTGIFGDAGHVIGKTGRMA